LGYKIKTQGIDHEGKNYWTLIRTDNKEMTIDESYTLSESEEFALKLENYMSSVLTPENLKEAVEQFHKI
jgi:hypothetical protein